MTRPALLATLVTLSACAAGEVPDSGGDTADLLHAAGTDGGSSPDDGGCEEVEVDYDGEDPPSVGTTWTLIPRCDGALVLGAVVIRVEPPESASLDENLITFEQAGICEVSVQVGSEVGTLEVEVME